MTKRQWLKTLSPDEVAFFMYGKDYFNRRCDECVFFQLTEDGYKCVSDEYHTSCETQYNEWLDEEM